MILIGKFGGLDPQVVDTIRAARSTSMRVGSRCPRVQRGLMSTTPIANYALLSDRHSAALVSRDGSIDWLCFPRFDSPSVFARLLGVEAGHWSLRATYATQVTRRYLDRTMVLETTFRTPTGAVALT